MPSRLIIVQHHALEAPGHIAEWAASNGVPVQQVMAWQAELPKLQRNDAVLLLGGPYSVHDAQRLPWLRAEQAWLANVIAAGHSVFGICMGAQLLAQALGATISTLESAELGWVDCAVNASFSAVLGANWRVLQWHSEGFSLPTGAKPLGNSEYCAQQGFALHRGAQVLMGVQFHPEWDADLMRHLIAQVATPLERLSLTAALDEHAAFAAQSALTERLLQAWFA